MEQTLKITSVLSDPTRYYIYQHIVQKHSEVTVQDIAENFNIHPNVARLHLSKLEDIKALVSETKKTGKGGRPSRLYRLSDQVIQLHFPFRDYQLLSKIALNTMMKLGEAGKKALFETGRQFGEELMHSQFPAGKDYIQSISFEEKMLILKNAAGLAGFSPEFDISEDKKTIHFRIFNCPFREVASHKHEEVCNMHFAFLQGMFGSLFEGVELKEKDNMLDGCESCGYQALVTN